jgi:hypothetical protein
MSKGAGIMRKGILLIGSMAAIALAAGAVWAAAAPAPTPLIPFPSGGASAAALYKTTFVGAMETCDPTAPGAVTLHLAGKAGGKSSLAGCVPTASDPALRFGKASLVVSKKHGKIVLQASGLPVGQQVVLGLTLQPSRESAKFWEFPSGSDVTYMPLSLTCPGPSDPAGEPLVASSKGKIVLKSNLDLCYPLVANAALETDPNVAPPPGGSENKTLGLQLEVLDAVLIDANGGGTCVGGSTPGAACNVAVTCPSIAAGTCNLVTLKCVAGLHPGATCAGNSDCPGSTGVCAYSGPPFARAGIAR